jgi:hypothetical protein
MAWVRLDDQAPRNEKILRAGPAASWLWVCGIAHAQSQLTDGFISEVALPLIGVKGHALAKRLAEDLVAAGLFDRADSGYLVHDYLDYNPSRAVVFAKRAEDAARKRFTDSTRTPAGIQPDSGGPRARVPSHPIRTVPKNTEGPTEPARPVVSANGNGKKAPVEPIAAKQFLQWFQEEYRRSRFGADYLVKWDKDVPLVKRMLAATTLERLKKYAEILLNPATDDEWIATTDRGIGVLSSRFNWLSERYAEWEATHGRES